MLMWPRESSRRGSKEGMGTRPAATTAETIRMRRRPLVFALAVALAVSTLALAASRPALAVLALA